MYILAVMGVSPAHAVLAARLVGGHPPSLDPAALVILPSAARSENGPTKDSGRLQPDNPPTQSRTPHCVTQSV